ncbi:glucose 1-dehydrogenase [Alkalicoccus urumqiensis]|uniref:2-deoxy-D-gluconate 3-dehydrogenase n=1 Tax=Alkalicoccus urumqiensis TaxID=1548213 RepID=A0A2P6MJR0_ALKUR|nr:glucose 1-dehydrogenase [Alkalicoccus urumqiensis]PRO66520.1 2-deoxy-D-gluconate 3-dehydrogenase [Alkalicoccus urumqiensis]
MQMTNFSLSQKTAVVTGAARGIGKAAAEGLAEAGADVVLVQRSGAEETKKAVESFGRTCHVIQCDLQDSDAVKAVIPEVVDRFGTIDILVNNAGIQKRHPAVDFPEEDWELVMNIQLKAVWLLSQAAGRVMTEQGSGSIISIASLQSFQGGLFIPAYASAKGAVAQLTKALANEWASKGVNVNAVAPGYVATDMNEALIEDPVRSRQIMERIPAGRWGQPEDFKGPVVFLASEAADFIHGHVLTVDGGWMGR